MNVGTGALARPAGRKGKPRKRQTQEKANPGKDFTPEGVSYRTSHRRCGKVRLEAEEFACGDYQEQGEGGDRDFADEADCEWAEALFAHFAKIRAETYTGEGKKKRPARKIGEGEVVVLGEEACGGERGDQQESQNKFREFLPEEGGFVSDGLGLATTGPIDGVGEDDETDESVASGLGEDGELCGGVGIESASGGGFGGIVDGETRPNAIGVIREMEGVADERKREESDGAESEDGGDGEGGIFVVGIDGALSGDDSADTADRRTDSEKRGEFGTKTEEATEERHEGNGAEDFNADKEQTDSAELPDVAKKKARAEKNDASLQPELIGGDARLEDGGKAEDVGDNQAKKDGPKNVFNVGEDPVVSLGVAVDIFFEEFSSVADDGEKSDTWNQAEELRV
jgi:hypothetical protein